MEVQKFFYICQDWVG